MRCVKCGAALRNGNESGLCSVHRPPIFLPPQIVALADCTDNPWIIDMLGRVCLTVEENEGVMG
jgi:hypothetical protein